MNAVAGIVFGKSSFYIICHTKIPMLLILRFENVDIIHAAINSIFARLRLSAFGGSTTPRHPALLLFEASGTSA